MCIIFRKKICWNEAENRRSQVKPFKDLGFSHSQIFWRWRQNFWQAGVKFNMTPNGEGQKVLSVPGVASIFWHRVMHLCENPFWMVSHVFCWPKLHLVRDLLFLDDIHFSPKITIKKKFIKTNNLGISHIWERKIFTYMHVYSCSQNTHKTTWRNKKKTKKSSNTHTHN